MRRAFGQAEHLVHGRARKRPFGARSEARKELRLDIFVVWIEPGMVTHLKMLHGKSWSFFLTVSNFLGKLQEKWR
jgi:hypothetical protein